MGSVFDALFGDLSASRSGRRADRKSPTTDQEAILDLDIEEAFRGGQRALSLTDADGGEPRQYNVQIPPGVRPGQRIRLAGQGSRRSSGAGDLYLVVRLRPSQRFRLEGEDMHTTLVLSPWEAALGATVLLHTLGGTVRVKVPAGSCSGRKIRLKGKGYPTAQRSRGNLYAEVRIEVPSELSREERTLLERWAQISRFRPRSEKAR